MVADGKPRPVHKWGLAFNNVVVAAWTPASGLRVALPDAPDAITRAAAHTIVRHWSAEIRAEILRVYPELDDNKKKG